MRIVYLVADVSGLSGGMRIIAEHVNRLSEHGHEVELWTPPISGEPAFDIKTTIKQYDAAQLDMPDVVVMTDPGFLKDVTKNRKKRNTYLLMQHDNEWVAEVTGSSTYADSVGEYIEFFRSGRIEIIAVSGWLVTVIRERYGLESHLVLNGIDQDLFKPTDPVMTYTEPTVMTYYDPQNWKGFPDAFMALLEVRKSVPNLRVIVLGRSFPETPKVEGMSYGFPFPVVYFNRPAQSDLASIYSSADVFVSTSWKEGFGLTGLEALACGVPLVTTNNGGNVDYAHDGETALIVGQSSVEISVGILRMLDNDTLRKRLIQSGLEKAAEFQWNNSIACIENIFNRSILQT